MEPVAGKFEVLRLEIGGIITMPLREIIFAAVREDFAKRGFFSCRTKFRYHLEHFGNTMDLAASLCLENHFNAIPWL